MQRFWLKQTNKQKCLSWEKSVGQIKIVKRLLVTFIGVNKMENK